MHSTSRPVSRGSEALLALLSVLRFTCSFVDFLQTSTSNDHSAVERLAQACERAVFGRGGEAVLDETYRKAGKMDTSNFKTGLDLESTRLLDTVRLGLLPDAAEMRIVRPELYKLNVYSEYYCVLRRACPTRC